MRIINRKNPQQLRAIYLIGGAPCIGKTTVAKQLAKQLGIPRLETDTFSLRLQRQMSTELEPSLHLRGNRKVDDYYQEFNTPEKASQAERVRANRVADYIAHELMTGQIKGPIIIEGIAVTPSLVEVLQSASLPVRIVFLYQPDYDKIASLVRHRGMWDKAHKYPDSYKQLEIDWTWHYQSTLIKEIKKADMPLIECGEWATLGTRLWDELRF